MDKRAQSLIELDNKLKAEKLKGSRVESVLDQYANGHRKPKQ